MRNGNIDPYKVARSNYYKRETNYDRHISNLALKDFKDFICGKPWIIDTELLTVEKALYGDPHNPLYSAIPSGTSAGAPIKYLEPHLKKELLGPGKARDSTNPVFATFELDMKNRISRANEGIRLEYLYTDNLKDTLVSIPKFLEGKGRLFSGACLRLCVGTKCVFGKSIEFFAKNSIEKGFATTLNPYSSDWHKVAYDLSRFSPSMKECMVLCMDYSKFDACHTVETMEEALEVINDWYAFHGCTDFAKARSTFFKEITNSLHLVFNVVEKWDGSMPSGSLLTLLVNGIINHLNLRYCYYKLVPISITSQNSFSNMVAAIVQGDDVLMSMHEKIRQYFTPEGVISCMNERGYVVTSDDKSKPIGFVPLTEATFLKRGFNIEDGFAHGNLAMDTILNTPLWSKKGDYYRKITRDSVEFFFRELSLHPKSVFDLHAPTMRKAVVAAKFKDFEGLTWNHAKWRSYVYSTEPFTMDL
jgi:hypothetical protein